MVVKDPRTHAAVMARGIVGSRGASPLHKEVYDLATGAAVSGGTALRNYPVRCVDGVVELSWTSPLLPEPAQALRGKRLRACGLRGRSAGP